MNLPTGDTLRDAIESRLLYRREAYELWGLLFLSNSTLKVFTECQTKALLTALGWGPIEQSPYAFIGTCGHEAMAHWGRGGTPDDAVGIFEAHYAPFAAERGFEPDDALHVSNATRVLDAWFLRYGSAFPFKVRPDLVELPFLVPLEDDLMLCGKPDGIVEDAVGCFLVNDYKSTLRMDGRFLRQFRNNSQLKHYIFGVREHTDRPVVGGIITAWQWDVLPSSTRPCRSHGVQYAECSPLHLRSEIVGPIPCDEDAISAWRLDVLAQARRYRALLDAHPTIENLHDVPMEGQFTGACANCEFADFCERGRPLEYIDSMLTLTPFDDAALSGEKETHGTAA